MKQSQAFFWAATAVLALTAGYAHYSTAATPAIVMADRDRPTAPIAAIPSPPVLGSKAYILMSADTGAVLAEKNADKEVVPASITKLMTSYVVAQALKAGDIALTDTPTISKKAWQMGGSKMFIEVDKQVPVGELIKGMAIVSGNDASVALAEHVAGSEGAFAQLMNHAAQTLGMSGSYFLNATGLDDEGHVMTARDIAVLSRALLTQHKTFSRVYGEIEYQYNDIKQQNRNPLLGSFPGLDFGKTGWVGDSSGYNLVTSSEQNGDRFIAVVLGADSATARGQDARALLQYGHRFFETAQVAEPAQSLSELTVFGGAASIVPLVIDQGAEITVPRKAGVNLEIETETSRWAPIEKGEVLGQVTATSANGEPLGSWTLTAAKSVEEGPWYVRLWHTILGWFS